MGNTVGNDYAAELEADLRRAEEHIAELDARAITRDHRIAELIEEDDGLRAAAESRAVIEQAKGTIMAATGCSADAAFAVLVAQSQTQNRKLREIASEIMALKRRKQSTS